MKATAIFCFALVLSFVLAGWSAEPSYHGRTLSSWLKDLSNTPAGPEYKPAADAIHQMGAETLPYLVKEIENRNSHAVNAFRELGRVAQPAIPPLTDLLQKEDITLLSALALVAIGGEEPVINALKSTNSVVSGQAIWALGDTRSSENATFALLPFLNSGDPKQRCASAWALGAIQKQGKLVVPALLKSIEDRDLWVREKAIVSLGNFKSEAQAIVPALFKVISDTNSGVRPLAVQCLGWIGVSPDEQLNKATIVVLVKMLEEQDTYIRQCAAWSLGVFGARAKDAFPALIKLAGSQDKELRNSAISSLRSIDRTAALATGLEYKE